MPIIIPLNQTTDLSRALEFLNKGEIIAFPTDTVYGIGVLLGSSAGIQKLYHSKARSPLKAIAVLIGGMDQLPQVVNTLPTAARKLAERYWPGALTLVLPKQDNLPENISPYPTIGVRMPDHPIILDLLKITGPLATTSANLSGGKDPVTAREVLEQLGEKIGFLFDGGKTAGGIPSTVVDCTQSPPVILRQGAISAQEIFKVILNDEN